MQVHGRRKTKCALGQRKVFYWSFFHIPTSQNITAQRKRFYSTQLFTNTSFWARRENWGVSGELTSISGFSDVFVHVWYKKQRTAFGYRFCGIRKKKKKKCTTEPSRIRYCKNLQCQSSQISFKLLSCGKCPWPTFQLYSSARPLRSC